MKLGYITAVIDDKAQLAVQDLFTLEEAIFIILWAGIFTVMKHGFMISE